MKKLFIIFFLILTSINAIAQEPITVHVANLPQIDDKEQMVWLNPPQFNSSADGQSPIVRYKTQAWPTTMAYLGNRGFVLDEPIKLFGGWNVQAPEKNSCLDYKLVLKRDTVIAKFNIKRNRQSGFFSRRLSCIGGSATAYEAIYLNSRYMAFSTSEPGWIFFDYKNGKFMPFIIATNPNHGSNLFVTKSGKILVEIQVNTQGKTNSSVSDKEANGLREINVNSQKLEAPLNTIDIVEIEKIKKENECAIEKKMNRPCS